MNISVFGSGMIGGTAALLFAQRGHSIGLCNRRGAESLTEQVTRIGPQARAMRIDEAAHFGELIFLAIPFAEYRRRPAGPLAGKVVVDAITMNSETD
jgi:hypothetical protein